MKRELRNYAGDDQYLAAVRSALAEAFDKFQPQLIIYNAGTDILQGERGCRMGWDQRLAGLHA